MKRNLSMLCMLLITSISNIQIYAMKGYTAPHETASKSQSPAGKKVSRGFGAQFQEEIQSENNANMQKETSPEVRLNQAKQDLSDMQSNPEQNSIDLGNMLIKKKTIISLQDQKISEQSNILISKGKKESVQVTNVKLEIQAVEDEINQLRKKIHASNNDGINVTDNMSNLQQFDLATTKLIKLKDEVIRLQENRIQKQGRTKNLWDSSLNRVNTVIESLKISPQTAAKVKAPVSSIFSILSGKQSSGNQTADLKSIDQNLHEVVTILGKDNARPILQSMQTEIQQNQLQSAPKKAHGQTNASSSGSSFSGSNPFDFYVDGPGGIPMKQSTVVEGQILGAAVEGAIEVAPIVGQAIAGVAYGALQLIGALLGGGI